MSHYTMLSKYGNCTRLLKTKNKLKIGETTYDVSRRDVTDTRRRNDRSLMFSFPCPFRAQAMQAREQMGKRFKHCDTDSM